MSGGNRRSILSGYNGDDVDGLLMNPDAQAYTSLGAQVVVEESTARINQGVGFFLSFLESFASSEVKDILVQVGDHAMHVRSGARANVDMQFDLFEGATFSDPGTPQTSINRNRESAKVSSVAISSGATITAPGTPLFTTFIQTDKATSSNTPIFQKLILAKNTTYLVRATSLDTGQAGSLVVALDYHLPGLVSGVVQP